MSPLHIPRISQAKFLRKLSVLPNENLSLIATIESFFRKKRGYVFRMPKPGSPVVLLVSGGLDSTISWAILMHRYKLKVYPVFLHRGMKRKRKEKKAMLYFADIFQKRYPDQFVPPAELTTHLPPPEIESHLEHIFDYHPIHILNNLNVDTHTSEILSHSGLPIIYPFYAQSYAAHLWYTKGIRIRTVFNAVATRDGVAFASQSFTSLRATLLAICTSTGEYDWQFASLPFEKELGFWVDKAEFIRIGHALGLPLEKTWSCYRAGLFQCGNRCATCYYRREEFARSGVPDKTVYASDITIKHPMRIFRQLLPYGDIWKQ